MMRQRLQALPRLWQSITNLDFVHDVKAVLVALVGERDPDQCVHKTVCIVRCSCKSVAEVRTGVGD